MRAVEAVKRWTVMVFPQDDSLQTTGIPTDDRPTNRLAELKTEADPGCLSGT